MIVPKVSVNIISSSQLDLLGYTQIIENGQYNILKCGQLAAKGPLQPDIKCAMDIERPTSVSSTPISPFSVDANTGGYAVTAKHINNKWTLQNGVRTQCILDKSKLPSFPQASTEKGKEPGDYLVTDIMGPFATDTLLGEKYALTYIYGLVFTVLVDLSPTLKVRCVS
jgi:hypothetical protein